MDPTNSYDLNSTVEEWLKVNCPTNEFTDADINEFRDQFLCVVEELITEKNIEIPKAVELAKNRMGDRYDWQGEMKLANENVIKLREVIFLLIGVLLYFLGYHLILSINRIIFLISNHYNGIEPSVNLSRYYFNSVYAFTVSGFVAIYFLHYPMKWILDNLKLKFNTVIILIFILIVSILIERYLFPVLKNQIHDDVLLSLFLSYESMFEYLFFIITILGFIFIFKRYNSKFYR